MKKIIALLLSLLMLMQFGTAFAEKAEEEFALSPDMMFATSLGILDEYYVQTAPLTRLELATVFYNIVMPDVSPYMNNSKHFSDVGFSSAAYADFVCECKIMNGVASGLFAPDANVTYAQLIKTIVAFLGYTEIAETKGGYPYGYINVAQSLGLINSQPQSIDSFVTVNMLASILRLATIVPLMERISYGSDEVNYKIDKNSNYLETYMNITRIQGVVTANYLADLDDSDTLYYDQIKVDGELYYITESSDDIIDNLGYEVDIYVKSYGEESKSSIIYYELSDSNIDVTIDGEDIKDFSSGKLNFYENEKEKTAKIAPDASVIYNGSLALSYDDSVINPFKNSNYEGDIKIIDNDNDGTYEVVMVDAYKSYVVKNIVGSVIFPESDHKGLSADDVVNLGYDFKDGDIAITNILGEPIMLSEIEEGDIISVSRDINNQPKKIVVTINTYTGILNEINYSEKTIYVDGYEFKMSKKLTSDDSYELGKKITVYFNKGRKVSDIKAADDKYSIGYLVDRKISSGVSPKYTFRIFTQSSDFVDLTLAEKVELSDTGKKVSASIAYDELPVDASGLIRQPVLYTVDSDGLINWIDWCRGEEPRDGIYMIKGFDGTEQTLYYRSSQYNFESKLLIGASTIIFNVPEDSEVDDYDNYYVESTSANHYKDGKFKIDFTAYAIGEEDSPCAAIIVDKDGCDKAADGIDDANIFVVDEITSILNDGKECYKIKGWDYTSGVHSITVEKGLIDTAYPSGLPGKGDILQVLSFNGVVKYVEPVFDFNKTKKFKSGTNPSATTFAADLRCVYGDVVYNDGGFMKVKLENSEEILFFPVSNARFVEIDFSESKKGVLRAANSACVYDSKNYPSHSSKVVVRTRDGSTRTIVVYNGLGGAN